MKHAAVGADAAAFSWRGCAKGRTGEVPTPTNFGASRWGEALLRHVGENANPARSLLAARGFGEVFTAVDLEKRERVSGGRAPGQGGATARSQSTISAALRGSSW